MTDPNHISAHSTFPRPKSSSSAGRIPPSAEPSQAKDPSPGRHVAVLAACGLLIVGLFQAARSVAGELDSPRGIAVSIACALLAAILIGSLGEWFVHRYLMHRRVRLPPLNLAYDLHHLAHHWVQYPPDEYLHDDEVQRVPVSRHLDRVCTTRLGRALTVALHVAFYSIFGVVLVFVPSFVFTGNPIFTAVVSAVTIGEIFLFVRVHDAVHHPGLSRLERFAWFRFLDRHHYIHHVDNRANTNFLLPLCDLLMGTLRRELTEKELARWPTYEEARRCTIRPTFDHQGLRIKEPVRRNRMGAM